MMEFASIFGSSSFSGNRGEFGMRRLSYMLFLVALICLSRPAWAQQQEQDNQTFAFDVASIRLNNSQPGKWSIAQPPKAGRFDAVGIPIASLLAYIYSPQKIRSDDIEGLPDWTYSDQWDISARTDDSVLNRENTSYGPSDMAEVMKRNRLRLETLLATRFSFRAKFVTETRSVLVLTAINGSKLTPSKGGTSSAMIGFGVVKGSSQTTDSLATVLANALQEQVLNETNLHGAYDYTLKWQPETDANVPLQGESIFSAVKEQLGLELRREKRPVQVLEVEHIERPSPN